MSSNYLNLLDLSYVRRWAVAPTTRDQSVMEHTARVLAIAFHIRALVPELQSHIDRGELAIRVMGHDAEERMTGDVPGPVKSAEAGYLRDVREMSRMDCLVKVADSIETGTFWTQWGNPGAWSMHPYNCAPARDIHKIHHYAAKVDGMLQAAFDTWTAITGGNPGGVWNTPTTP